MDAFTYAIELSNGLTVRTAVEGAETSHIRLVQSYIARDGTRSSRVIVTEVRVADGNVDVRAHDEPGTAETSP